MKRRAIIKAIPAGLGATLLPTVSVAAEASLFRKPIPSSGASLPVIGLGSWQTFNIGSDPRGQAQSTAVIGAFLQAGGTMIDSSPMYGSSQAVIGRALQSLGKGDTVFATDKVWTSDAGAGGDQYQQSLQRWQLPRFTLMQVHNLLEWQAHLELLQEKKREGELDYVGVTTSHGRRHGDLEQLMLKQPLDFVQLTYNLRYRDVEQRLLPLAKEKGIAVIANRPFDGGRLIRRLKREPFPEWARGMGLANWADFCLRYVVSHEAMTCAIPATSNVAHLAENMQTLTGRPLAPKERKRMQDTVLSL